MQEKQDKEELHDAELPNVLRPVQQLVSVLNLNTILVLDKICCTDNLEEDEEGPKSKQKADPAKELDEGVRVVSSGMVIFHSTRDHHLHQYIISTE